MEFFNMELDLDLNAGKKERLERRAKRKIEKMVNTKIKLMKIEKELGKLK